MSRWLRSPHHVGHKIYAVAHQMMRRGGWPLGVSPKPRPAVGPRKSLYFRLEAFSQLVGIEPVVATIFNTLPFFFG